MAWLGCQGKGIGCVACSRGARGPDMLGWRWMDGWSEGFSTAVFGPCARRGGAAARSLDARYMACLVLNAYDKPHPHPIWQAAYSSHLTMALFFLSRGGPALVAFFDGAFGSVSCLRHGLHTTMMHSQRQYGLGLSASRHHAHPSSCRKNDRRSPVQPSKKPRTCSKPSDVRSARASERFCSLHEGGSMGSIRSVRDKRAGRVSSASHQPGGFWRSASSP